MKQFIEMLRTAMAERLGEETIVDITEVVKRNDTKRMALCVRSKNGICGRNVYVEPYYRMFLRDTPLDEVVEEIADFLEKDRIKGNPFMDGLIILDWLTNYSKAKERLMFRLVNAEANQEYLRDAIRKPYLDLYISIYLLVNISPNQTGTVTVTKSMLDAWGVSEDEVFAQAMENTRKTFPETVLHVNTIVEESLSSDEFRAYMNVPEDKVVQLYVLTNNRKIDGAGTVLYEGVLRDVADKLGLKHFVIFLSSVHELILMPSDPKDEDIPYLQKMVREINATVVAPDEWLSTNVYHYDREKDEVRILLPTEKI